MNESFDIPDQPEFSDELIQSCHETGNFSPVLFEWYKFTAQICNFFARIDLNSAFIREIQSVHYAVLSGSLNRCSRLMLANINLSHQGLYGETTAILDRTIFETAIKVAWLCAQSSDESFIRFLADGLKTELELKQKILSSIEARQGESLPIEDRMLQSISQHIGDSGLEEGVIGDARKLPNLYAMLENLGLDRLIYISMQKIGSHHVHGTWPSLKFHYLRKSEDGAWCPRDHDCHTDQIQYAVISLLVLSAIESFVEFICRDEDDREGLGQVLVATSREIEAIIKVTNNQDFETQH